jgi:flagellar protein FlaJ
MIFVFPMGTFFLLYLYPGLERKSDEGKIDQELPFATIHMASVSGSMIDPTKIFSILVSTGDYPNISKQFIKLINQINLQGESLVNSLRSTAFNSPSEKLSDLMGGLATTITSGGDLPDFFEKRAQSLMLDYRLEKEKYAKTAETFMDIYISVVIAAPMILMLLLIMMNVSGLGGGISAGSISLMMVLGVSTINFAFLIFLHIRGATKGG